MTRPQRRTTSSGRRLAGALVALSIATLGSACATGASTSANTPAQITVTADASTPMGVIPATAFGLNASAYDTHLLDATIPGLMKGAGVKVVRYPGGSVSDTYQWDSNTDYIGQGSIGGGVDADNTFDRYMQVVQATGAQAMITVNYGSGTPQDAAHWVRYANKGGPGYTGTVPTYAGASPTGNTYGIQYWEIGNELYGNGTYGSHWETDVRTNNGGKDGPDAYGANAANYIAAMKAVDPGIKVGVVLTAPGNWPDAEAGLTPNWNATVLPHVCSTLDFADVHWYPQDPDKEDDVALLSSPEQGIPGRTDSIPTMVAHLRQEISAACPGRADQIQIMITETNSVSYDPGKQTTSQTDALFAADSYMTWLENGVANVDWWQLHNGPVIGKNNSASLYGTADYGDYGILADGTGSEPAANTPLPAYYAFALLNDFAHAGDTMLKASSDNPLVTVHAVRRADGHLALLCINKDQHAAYSARLSLSGGAAPTSAKTYFYGQKSTAITSPGAYDAHAKTLTLPAYSLTVLVL